MARQKNKQSTTDIRQPATQQMTPSTQDCGSPTASRVTTEHEIVRLNVRMGLPVFFKFEVRNRKPCEGASWQIRCKSTSIKELKNGNAEPHERKK